MHTLEREPGVDGEIAWIGPAPSPLAITAILLIGTVGMLICGIQPVVLGALVNEHRLSATQLGWATTAEFLTLGVAISAAGMLFSTRRLKLKMIVAALVATATNLMVAGEAGAVLIANRAITGLAEGILVWCAICMVTRSSAPARWSGIFLTAQGISQLAFAAAAPPTVITWMGANGGFFAMAGTTLIAALAALLIPDAMEPLPAPAKHDGAATAYTPAAIATLASVFLIAAFSIGLFAYLAPLASQSHLDNRGLGLVVSVVLGASIAGSSVAAATANRVTYFSVFVACLVINAAVLIALCTLPGLVPFTIAAAVFGFAWLYFLPFQLPFVIESDPTRRIATIVPGVQLFGGAAGPLLCSFFVSDTDSRGALVVCGACFLIAFLISAVLHVRHLRDARLAQA